MKDLIKLKYSKNAEGKYHCPVTYKTFTNNSKIAAIATSGNVYSYAAIEELNIKSKNWNDLLSGENFRRSDIIVLQDSTRCRGKVPHIIKGVKANQVCAEQTAHNWLTPGQSAHQLKP